MLMMGPWNFWIKPPDHQVDVIFRERGQDLLLELRLLADNDGAGDARLPGPLGSPNAGLVGDHQGDGAAFQLPPSLGINERLQIGAAAGGDHGDPGGQHRTTFSSPETISPMM